MPGFRVKDIGYYDLSSDVVVSSEADYYYTYTWSIRNLFGTSAKFGTYNAATGQNSDPATSIIHLKEATLPTFTVNKEPVLGADLEYKYAKSVTWDDIRVVWYDTVGFFNVVKAWRQSVWHAGRGLSPAADYKKASVLATYTGADTSVEDTDGKLNGIVNWKLFGSWPSVIRYGDLTYTNSDIKIIEVTVTYDRAIEGYKLETSLNDSSSDEEYQ